MGGPRARTWLGITALLGATACTDLGEDPGSGPSPEPSGPSIAELVPKRTVVGDTVRVLGSGFGSDPAGSAVLFPSEAQDVEATIVSWSANEIVVLVPGPAPAPDSTIIGPVHVRVDSTESNGVQFSVADSLISYEGDLKPIFEAHGCLICHQAPSFEGLLHVYPWTNLVGRRPAVVLPRNGPQSSLVTVMLPTTDITVRMPDQGSGYDYLNPSEILAISDWIDQGARDN
jgi:hypothetical protein